MQWDAIVERVRNACVGDPALVAIFGSAMRYTGSGDHAVPLLEWMLIADGQQEQWAPCTVQLDVWHRDLDAVVTAERRLRRLFHQELPFDFEGLTTWGEYLDGEVLASPDRDGYFGRALRFRLTPLRDRYVQAP